MKKKFVSAVDASVYITVSDEVREHIMFHFAQDNPGSKFCHTSPDELLQFLVDGYPQAFQQAALENDGRKRVSLVVGKTIGTCNVVPTDLLTEEEFATMRRVWRGDKVVRVVASQRVFPTNECQLVLSSNSDLITVYPGEAAPPLPATPDVHDSYWDCHVFISTSEALK